MRFKLHASAFCILLALSGTVVAQETGQAAAASAPAATDGVVPAVATATAPAATASKVGAPEAGKALIVFFRPSKFTGAAIGFKVREGETELGKLRNGKYFLANVEPGTHQYTVHSEAKDVGAGHPRRR